MSEFKPGDRVRIRDQSIFETYRVIGPSLAYPGALWVEGGGSQYATLRYPDSLEHAKTPKQKALEHAGKYYKYADRDEDTRIEFGREIVRLIYAIEEKE